MSEIRNPNRDISNLLARTDRSSVRPDQLTRSPEAPSHGTINEFRDALQTGIQDAETKRLTPGELVDKANVIRSWTRSHADHFSEKEKETLYHLEQAIHNTFNRYNEAARFWGDRVGTAQTFRDAAQSYFEFNRKLQNPIERFCFAKDIHPLTSEQIKERKDYFDGRYDVRIQVPDGDFHTWQGNDFEPRITVKVYKKGLIDPNDCYYSNTINLKDYSVEGDNNRGSLEDWKHGPGRMPLSEIKYQSLQEALDWVGSTDNPNFAEYKHLSTDNFQPRSLKENHVIHTDTKRTVLEVIEAYKKGKREARRALTPGENGGKFFFPLGSDEFYRIIVGTDLGKEKLFFLGNHYPDLRCAGVGLRIMEATTRIPFVDVRAMEYPLEKK